MSSLYVHQAVTCTKLSRAPSCHVHQAVTCTKCNILSQVSLHSITPAGYFNDPNLPDTVEEALQAREAKLHDMKVLRNINHHHSN